MREQRYLIVDAHQDIAYNMHTWQRDYIRGVDETRRREAAPGTIEPPGSALLGWPEYQRGRVAVIFATLFAAPVHRARGEWDVQVYRDTAQAHTLYRSQLDTYHRLFDDHPDHFQLVQDRRGLDKVLAEWQSEIAPGGGQAGGGGDAQGEEWREDRGGPIEGHPVGLVLLMEGAEAVREPAELEMWWARGVRIIAPAWAGNRFCGGTDEPGPLTLQGYALLDVMADFGFALDLSHMDERAALQALDHFPGTIIASHSNVLALLEGQESNRSLSDRLLHGLVERDATIGIMPFNDYLLRDWRHRGGRGAVSLNRVVAHIDYICQMAGDAHHVGLGTAFDGGFGLPSVPAEIDTIADLQKLVPLLLGRGYTEEDVAAILGLNWISFLRATLP